MSGVDLARVALRTAMEVARKNGGGRKTRRKLRAVTTVRRDGREPMGFGAVIGALVTEQAWGLPAAGAMLREWWAAIAPELAGHVASVAYDPDSGRLTRVPGVVGLGGEGLPGADPDHRGRQEGGGPHRRQLLRILPLGAARPTSPTPRRSVGPEVTGGQRGEGIAAGEYGLRRAQRRSGWCTRLVTECVGESDGGDFVLTDRRRIQTAVLGGVDSDEPLMLPMEAIELDAFRRAHEDDTFWCGTLLGGCGGQLTTKLYTDRACHFAHHPAPDGLPHVCGRRSRGVDSADHLYVRSAAAAWLAGRGEQATFEYTRTEGAPIGSIVDVRWRHGALRVHLDQAVAPVWDHDVEPVLGTRVPVDRDTLIRRWYVHRIRLNSVGTARHVQIGTEAFARPIEWFALDQCEMTERGLSTPTVEKIVQARSAPRPSLWSPGKARKMPKPEARAQALLRRLVYARRIESVSLVKQVCGEIEDLTGVGGELQEQLEAAVRHARVWLVEQGEERRKLFDNLNTAVDEHKPGQVRRLLMRVNATASEDRTDAESAVRERASTYFESLDDLTRDAVEAEADTEKEARKAAARVRSALRRLRGYDAYTPDLRPQVEELLRSAALAGELLTRGEAQRVEVWKKRVALGPREQLRVARRYWIQRSCPRCNAKQGKDCVLVEGPNSGKPRKDGHNERMQLELDERKTAQKLARQQKKARHEVEAPAETMQPTPKAHEHEVSPARPLHEQRLQSGRKGQAHEAPVEAAARLHHQVPRGDWYRTACPRCHAGPGTLCENDDRVGPSAKRQLPHDERLRRVLKSGDRGAPGEQQKGARRERRHQAPPSARAEARPPRPRRRDREPQETVGSAARTWYAKDVTCPKCQAQPNSPCVPHGAHQERVKWAKEFTRKLWG